MRTGSLPIAMLLASGVAAFAPHAAAGQRVFPPEKLENVRALPPGSTVAQVVEHMRGYTRALGVRCTHCHVGTEGAPLASMDFVADTKPAKRIARQMIAMTRAINGDHLAKIAERGEPQVAVTCATCHRGITRPRSVIDETLMAYRAGGAAGAAARYRELRTRYYGDDAYDFGDVALTEVADQVKASGDAAGAIALLELNVEFLPQSWFGLWMLAEARADAGQHAQAVAALEKAVAIRPRADLVARLDELRKAAAVPPR